MKWLLLLVVIASVVVTGQERIVLTTPVFVSAGVRDFRVHQLLMQRGIGDEPESSISSNTAKIQATFREVSETGLFLESGRILTCTYTGPAAEALIIALNKADLSSNSLERRIITRCQVDGKLGPGTITGTP